jgi:hypothetical protein
MSYGLFGLSGISVSSSAPRGRARPTARERRRLEVVLRQEREQVARVLEARLLVGRVKCATPDFDACVDAPPSSSNVTSSPVTVFTTSGP